MNRVAWLTCALLAVADARIYERCELARELQGLGVNPEHISTWVCIAYHESRFDTTANNPYSGDHGIFQISEIYWCGPGKACGLPCSALRDEDISNDLECALQVHEEHTRLQGNGFLAWVVYPQHCKHNTKKYLVDCDTSVKKSVPITRSRPRPYYDNNYYDQPNETYYKQDVDALLPPYLAISSIFRGNYGKVLDNSKGRVDWYHYKYDKVDELKLPVFNKASQALRMPPATAPRSTTTTTTTTTYIPPVMPWRRIETNQFRKKKVLNTDRTQKAVSIRNNTIDLEKNTPRFSSTSIYQLPTLTTTLRPVPITSTAYFPNVSTTTLRSTVANTTYKPFVSTVSGTYSSTTAKPATTTEVSRKIETSTSRSRIATTLYNTHYKPSITPTSSRPRTIISTPQTLSTSTYKPIWTTTTRLATIKPNTVSWYTFTSRNKNTTPATTRIQTVAQTRSSQPVVYSSKLQTDYQSGSAQAAFTSKSTHKLQTTTQKPKSTQSIFDLYLNPTKPPKLPPYVKLPKNQFSLQIFAGGTTTLAPSYYHTKTKN